LHRLDIDPPVLADLSENQLQKMRKAGEAMITAERQLAKAGHSLVERIVGDPSSFEPWKRYPEPDVFDYESGSQYYFHAHDDRPQEYGHFHLFLREEALPMDAEAFRVTSDEDSAIAHLVAISMDRRGRPLKLFTTNGWVTSEDFYPATEIIAALSKFDVNHTHPCLALNQWLSAAVVFFGPHIQALLRGRDTRLAPFAKEKSWEQVLEDRTWEVITRMEVSPEAQMREIVTKLARNVAS